MSKDRNSKGQGQYAWNGNELRTKPLGNQIFQDVL